MGSPVVLKFKGQDRSRAGIAFDGQYSFAHSEDTLLPDAVFIRDIQEVDVWRAQWVLVTIPEGGCDFEFTTYYSDSDIGDLIRYP